MVRKIFFSIFLLFFFTIVTPVWAKSGCCSGHGGVSCGSGAQGNGHVICNDGWRGSSCLYSEMVMCGGSSNSTTTYTAPTTKPTARPTTKPLPTATSKPVPTETPRPTNTPTPESTTTPTTEPTLTPTTTATIVVEENTEPSPTGEVLGETTEKNNSSMSGIVSLLGVGGLGLGKYVLGRRK